MRSSLTTQLLLLLSFSDRVVSSRRHGPQQQAILQALPVNHEASTAASHSDDVPTADAHAVDHAILAALNTYPDPVDALILLRPGSAAELTQPRLIHVFGEPEPIWRTEGDKLRLRQKGKKFMDITDHQDLYSQPFSSWAGKASTSHVSLLTQHTPE